MPGRACRDNDPEGEHHRAVPTGRRPDPEDQAPADEEPSRANP